MFKKACTALLLVAFSIITHAQIIAGPMTGQVELRDAKVWLEVAPTVKKVPLQYGRKGTSARKTIEYKGTLGQEFNPIQFTIGGLDMATTYEYSFLIDGKGAGPMVEFTTKDLWQWRKPAPDFTFLTGSCAYFNQPEHDRPGKPYGGDSSIFETMAKEKAAFMLWMGDNWYTREVDYYSQWGLWYRAQHDRRQPVLQGFLRAMPHYAMWDDHDYGPNNSGASFIHKETSKKIFDSYWANPSSGHYGQGVYTQFGYSDVDFFLCDGRWWRAPDEMMDSVNGQPNPEKRMLGAQQMQWLKEALLQSTATFKIINMGSQVLNPASDKDKFMYFPIEYYELMAFIKDNRLDGVVFLTGDRHHSEVIKVERPGTYALYDVTVSSLTAGISGFNGAEKENKARLLGIAKNNYGRISVTGGKGQRQLKVEFIGTKGDKLGEWSVMESELKTPRQ